jgi:hypothetical protein
MGRSSSTFRQTDVVRAVRAVRTAGYDVARILIDKAGKLEIVTATEDEPGNALDEWQKKKDARQA